MKLCKCGCGEKIIIQNHHNWTKIPDFIHGHNRKGKKASQSTREKMSKTWKEQWADPKYKEQNCGRECSEETRRKISISQKGKIVSEETKQKLSKSHLGKTASNETKVKMSAAGMGRIVSEKTRQKLSLINSGRLLSEDHKKKLSVAHLGKTVSIKTRKKIGESMKRQFQNPEYCQKMMKAWKLKPNKPEILVLNLLNRLYPGEYKYTGDFSFMINGKNPDFVNCNGQKKIIELFGDYWHKGQNPKDRKKVFKPFGYETLVIWESELKDIEMVKFKINKFHRKEI